MENVINKLRNYKGEITFENIKELISEIDVSEINYQQHLPSEIIQTHYSRYLIFSEPIECLVMYWPPKTKTAIHLHKDFWGFVQMVKGELCNIDYVLNNDRLYEQKPFFAKKGDVIDEADNAIHRVENMSNEYAISVHYYYPRTQSLEDTVLFDLDGTIGILNKSAKSASLDLNNDCYKSFEKDVFNFVPHIKETSNI